MLELESARKLRDHVRAERHIEQARTLLEVAAALTELSLRTTGDKSREAIRGAAWRVADAAALYGTACRMMELEGTGITEATGRGCRLPIL